jgi:hypothetical protein
VKKNLTIGFLILTSISSLLFGFYQRTKAADNGAEVLKLEQMLTEANEKVEEQTQIIEFQKKISERLMEQVETLKLNAVLNEKNRN